MPPIVTINAYFISQARTMLEAQVLGSLEGELQNTNGTQRRTYNFGYSYVRMKTGDRSFTPVPIFLIDLCNHAIKELSKIAGKNLPTADAFNNCIVSVYERGFKLQPHIDVDQAQTTSNGGKYNFYFGDEIIGVVLQADENGRLYLIDNKGDPRPIPERDGTAFLLSGPERRSPHGVSPISSRRISATFRTVHFC